MKLVAGLANIFTCFKLTAHNQGTNYQKLSISCRQKCHQKRGLLCRNQTKVCCHKKGCHQGLCQPSKAIQLHMCKW